MSNSSGNPKSGKRDPKVHAFAAIHLSSVDPDLEDELAWMACEERKLKNALLREKIRTRAAERKSKIYLIWNGELRKNCTLLFTAAILATHPFLPGLHLQPEVLIALILLAGWTIRSHSSATGA